MRVRSQSPERTCMGCMSRDAKAAMVRVAAVGEVVMLDKEGLLPGRGGYLHRRTECLERFVRSKVKEFRSLRRRVALDERRGIAELIRTRLDSERTVE
ncbi:MAG TPA: YlxR family protein [Candidatus Binataceae bacterium]|nr:YlxR family protein [Candidatus Binataceae bacterium]